MLFSFTDTASSSQTAVVGAPNGARSALDSTAPQKNSKLVSRGMIAVPTRM